MKKIMGKLVNFIDLHLGQFFKKFSLVILSTLALAYIPSSSEVSKDESKLIENIRRTSKYYIYQKPIGPRLKKYPWNYNFTHVKLPFDKSQNLVGIEKLTRAEFEKIILLSVPQRMKKHVHQYLPMILDTAQRYGVDPFWVLAVIWTESHFRADAVSRVRAIGLMQVMPGTGHYLMKKFNRTMSPKLAYEVAAEPSMNVKMGTYYLKMLLKQFDGDFKLATVAYNMGPYRVRRRLKKNLPVGVQNQYLDKVRYAYRQLTRHTQNYF